VQGEEKLSSLQKERESARERYHDNKSLALRHKEEIQKNQNKIEQSVQEITRFEEQFKGFSVSFEQLQQMKERAQETFREARHALGNAEQVMQITSDQNFDLASKIAHGQNEKHRVLAHQEHLGERQKQVAELIARLQTELNEIQKQDVKLTKEKISLGEHLQTKKQDVRHESVQKEKLAAEIKELNELLIELREERAQTKHRIDLLNQLHGPSLSNLQAIMQKTAQTNGPVKRAQVLLDLLEIQDGYEVATAAALADFSKAIVTEDTETAVALLSQIRSDGHHQAAILIRDRTEIDHNAKNPTSLVQAHPLVKERLLDVLKIKSGYENLFSHLLGDVYIIDEMTRENAAECAKLADHVRLVSREGSCLGPRYQLTLRNGSLNPIQDLKKSDQEKSECVNRLQQIENEILAQGEALIASESRLKNLGSNIQDFSNRFHDLQLHAERTETTLDAIRNQQNRHQQEIELNQRDLREIAEETTKTHTELHDYTLTLKELLEKEQQIQMLLTERQHIVNQQKKRRDYQQLEFVKAQTKFESEETSRRQLKDSITLLRQNTSDLITRNADLESEINLSKQKMAQFENLSVKLQEREQSLQTALIDIAAKTKQSNEKREHYNRQRNDLESRRNQHRDNLQQQQNSQHTFEKKELELEYQKTSAIDRVRNTYHIQILEVELEQYRQDNYNSAAIREEIEKLSTKVEKLGAVNLMAIDEFEELKGRFEFLNTQRTDLEKSRDELLEAIRKINRTTKHLFEETLSKVREHFNQYFKTLFQGGHSDLLLIDESNPLESGLDIIARPPGKKPQHLSLLSGGEKALTAIALLFALFKIKASPFCVLDEIDAPLDETNTTRFNHVLREFLTTTQFIIVTHSRKTISMSDSLYGVTMEEPGVSKVVSVKIGQDLQSVQHDDVKLQQELNEALQ